MEVITIETPSLGDHSYLVHDGESAMVVDPQRDLDRVHDAARGAGVTITHVVETHLHNDYVSGGLVLARVTGAEYLHAADEDLSFDYTPVSDGDTFGVGTMQVEVVHTPGHTPHHLSDIVRSEGDPPAVFSGGSLLLGTVGRTDLVSHDLTDELTRAQFRSARRLAASLPDDAQVHPTHGFGSFCASVSSDDESDGTLGTERRVNLALTIDDEDEFVTRLVSGLTTYPRYYAHMAPLNQSGATSIDLSPPSEVDPAELARRIHRGEWVVDLRARRAFAADHVAGTIGIELEDGFATYVGWLIPWAMPLTLLGDTPEQVGDAQRQLVRIGIDRPSGAATGTPATWADEPDRRSYRAVTFAEVDRGLDGVVLDVRRADERDDGHIEGSLNLPIDEVLARHHELPDAELWVHCATGFRAAIAASLLDRAGKRVVLIDDEFEAAAEAGLPIASE